MLLCLLVTLSTLIIIINSDIVIVRPSDHVLIGTDYSQRFYRDTFLNKEEEPIIISSYAATSTAADNNKKNNGKPTPAKSEKQKWILLLCLCKAREVGTHRWLTESHRKS